MKLIINTIRIMLFILIVIILGMLLSDKYLKTDVEIKAFTFFLITDVIIIVVIEYAQYLDRKIKLMP